MFGDKDSWPENWSSQLVLVKKLLIASGTGDRLREERERLGLNQTDFGALAGVSRGTQKAYELQNSSPSVDYLLALQGMDVDVQYVLTGSRVSGDAGNLSVEEATLLEQYRQLPADQRAHTVTMVSALAEMAGRYEGKK